MHHRGRPDRYWQATEPTGMGSLSDARGTGCCFFTQSRTARRVVPRANARVESVRWAWDKRNTYHLAKELGIPTPVTSYPENLEQLADLDTSRPHSSLSRLSRSILFMPLRQKLARK